MGHEIEPTPTIYLFFSISSLVAFRDIDSNELTELPPGIFDSLALLTELYVLSLVAKTSFARSLPPSLCSIQLHPEQLLSCLIWPCNFPVEPVAIKAL